MNKTKNQPFTILASMLIINSNYVHGKLFLKSDGVYFKGNGQLETIKYVHNFYLTISNILNLVFLLNLIELLFKLITILNTFLILFLNKKVKYLFKL